MNNEDSLGNLNREEDGQIFAEHAARALTVADGHSSSSPGETAITGSSAIEDKFGEESREIRGKSVSRWTAGETGAGVTAAEALTASAASSSRCKPRRAGSTK